MSWFNKKEEKKEEKIDFIPKLPELPSLPQINEFEENFKKPNLHLPNFSDSSIEDRISQYAIKEAITGKKEGERFEANEFVNLANKNNLRMMPIKPQKISSFKEMSEEEIPNQLRESSKNFKKTEPVFIRIDKFEESLNIFEKTKKQISEIEKMLDDIKELKQKEEKELEFWEKEIQNIKQQIGRVDQDIFSKIE